MNAGVAAVVPAGGATDAVRGGKRGQELPETGKEKNENITKILTVENLNKLFFFFTLMILNRVNLLRYFINGINAIHKNTAPNK